MNLFKNAVWTLCLIVYTTSAVGQMEPTAEALLKQVGETYRQADTYMMAGDMEMVIESVGAPEGTPSHTFTATFKTAIRNPSHVFGSITTPNGPLMTVSDGERTRQYMIRNDRNEYTVNMSETAFFRESEYMYERIDHNLRAVKILGEETLEVDGKNIPCTIVESLFKQDEASHAFTPNRRRYWIDKVRHIVLKEESDAPLLNNGVVLFPFAGRIEIRRNTLRVMSASLNVPLDETLFEYTPPADMKKVETHARLEADLTGQQAPDFTLNDPTGTPVSLQSLRGKVVMLDFWATWCSPCRTAMPILEQLHQEYKDQGLVILGIDNEKPDVITEFLTEHGYTFPTLVDPDKDISKRYQVNGIPTTLIIGRDGKVVLHKLGYAENTEEILRAGLKSVGIE